MERRMWLSRLPEMRIAYFEVPDAFERATGVEPVPRWDVIGGLWDEFNDWRLRVRPALGRIDIAALGLSVGETGVFRAAIPIRGDYRPPEPAKTALFPGGSFAYVYADNIDEIDEASARARQGIDEQGFRRASGLIEVYKFHYNLEQHPCDCGYFVLDAAGREPVPPPLSHTAPLPIAPA